MTKDEALKLALLKLAIEVLEFICHLLEPSKPNSRRRGTHD